MTGILIVLVVLCQIGFWCLFGAGLVARYVMLGPPLGEHGERRARARRRGDRLLGRLRFDDTAVG
ncbi:hypothetical protein ACI784_04995 [Geodermatophilus sp. SYSU D01186]